MKYDPIWVSKISTADQEPHLVSCSKKDLYCTTHFDCSQPKSPMGIPGLTSYLKKSATEQKLACRSIQCNQSQGVVIDGPGLAYWIYLGLIRGYVRDGEINTRPSFELIKQITLDFLEILENHNLKILHIYFDGGLPVWKRATRFDRLRKDHAQSIALHAQQRDLKLIYSNKAPFATEDLLNSGPEYFKTNTNLVTPFLVPLVVESLQKSKFSEQVEIVPGEADAWCAAFAREHGATILTNDSDLAIYDLQDGRMVFLDSLTESSCDLCSDQCIVADVVHLTKVVQALSAKDMKHAAFDLLNSAEMLHKKHKFAKRSSKKPRISSSSTTFEQFCSRYSEISLDEDVDLRMTIQHLDPRTSEVVHQLVRPSDEQVLSILPLPVEDPSRRSVWTVSESIRGFTYSLLWHTSDTKNITLVEYIEKGQKQADGRVVNLLDEKACIDACIRLENFLRTIRAPCDGVHGSIKHWRTICSIHVCYHLLASEMSSSREIELQLNAVWGSLQSNSGIMWSQIHFRGQLEATYYAFRQLHQILRYLELTSKLRTFHRLPTLQQTMIDLPGIVGIFEASESDSKHLIDVGYVMKFAEEMLEA